VKEAGSLPFVTLDTNILVSSLLSDGPPAHIVDMIAEGRIRPCFNDAILAEYWDVFSLPKFGFSPPRIERLIRHIIRAGFGVEASAPSVFPLPDEGDRKFYDVAVAAGSILITGNIKHYPHEPFIASPADFLRTYR
jgi:putative PIN family toxin of toxin-antitoxin system